MTLLPDFRPHIQHRISRRHEFKTFQKHLPFDSSQIVDLAIRISLTVININACLVVIRLQAKQKTFPDVLRSEARHAVTPPPKTEPALKYHQNP